MPNEPLSPMRMFHSWGSALGIAVLGTILFASVGASLEARLADSSIPDSIKTQVVTAVVDSAGNAIPRLDAQNADVAADARAAFSDGTRYSAFAAAGFLAFGLLATLRLDSRREEHEAHELESVSAADCTTNSAEATSPSE